MREIKFRAWDKIQNRIVNVKKIDIFNSRVGLGWNEYDGITWRDYTEVELMQYTGLKDKNGREIYEGDIVKLSDIYIDDDIGFQDAIGIVSCEPKYCFFIDWKKVPSDDLPKDYTFNLSRWNELEVIGNVFEHNYLLEGK